MLLFLIEKCFIAFYSNRVILLTEYGIVMITTKYVREHIDIIKESLKKRQSQYPIDELLSLDLDYRKMQTELQELQAKRNKASLDISVMKKTGKNTDTEIIALRTLKDRIESIEAEMPSYKIRIEELLWNMPNVLHETVPFGVDDSENKVIKTYGTKKEPLDNRTHEDILLKNGLVDLERAAKIAGSRFYYLKGDLVLLEQSLIRFALDMLEKRNFTIIQPPFMLRKEFYKGATALGDFEDALYKVEDPKELESKKEFEKLGDELFMISTSEHSMAAMYSNELLDVKNLPIRLAGVSPCFRREAGSHGKDTKGIFRVHHFYKIEQFVFSKVEESWKIFDELFKNSEDIYQKLELPYQVVNVCTGDIGSVAAKKYDIEGYMPRQQKYRELVSCSNCTDWQSLRLDIKYDEKGERKYVHTLNSTAIATERTMVAIIENYTDEKGIIHIPKVLIPYMGKETLSKI